jgi:hypothetical protein
MDYALLCFVPEQVGCGDNAIEHKTVQRELVMGLFLKLASVKT